jgi:GNAT superfamily N-acetyltransferase
MFEQLFDNLRRTTDATIRMQQDFLRKWVSLCSAVPALPPVVGAPQKLPKRWPEIVGELFRKQRASLEAQFSAGLRQLEDTFFGGDQDLGELPTRTAALWEKAFDCLWQTYDFQVRELQSAVVRGAELLTRPAALPSCSAPPGYRDTADSGLLSLPDGTTVQVCRAGPEHQEALGDFFARLSPESRLRRFFTPSPPPREVIDALCDSSDPRSGLTLVATRTEGGELRIIATGSYLARDDRTAEVALAVEDASQGQGLGPLLLGRLARLAVRYGFTHFWGVTQADNQAVRKVLQESGFALEVRPEWREVLEVDLDLTAPRAR